MFENILHTADFCVVGGGIAGVCAAVAAARSGLKTLLMHDRPVLGGNASSEIRMWICGAQGPELRETGILEEISLENLRVNPDKKHCIFDAVLYGFVRAEKNITLLLNCSCMDGACENGRITEIRGWQLTTQRFHTVRAELFADCSGDSVLAPISGAQCRYGREAACEYGESLGRETADERTMGASCLIQARETESKKPYIPPEFAWSLDRDGMNNRFPNPGKYYENYWYLELGGDRHFSETEEVRDELIPLAYGVWDYVKNRAENRADFENYELDWVGWLPGKRESRRYTGHETVTQSDLEDGGARFTDIVAYGGWPMDDHPSEGFFADSPPNTALMPRAPYGIPFRALCSINIENLMFAGRNISATHVALSSTRVMGTCAVMGQAVGTAAALAKKYGLTPVEAGKKHLAELQDELTAQDCYIPGVRRPVGELTAKAALSGSAAEGIENLRNGFDRPENGADNGWRCEKGGHFEYSFDSPVRAESLVLVFDSALSRGYGRAPGFPEDAALSRPEYRHSTKSNTHLDDLPVGLPPTLVKDFTVTVRTQNGKRSFAVCDNARRQVTVPLGEELFSVRVRIDETHGLCPAHIFSAYLL